MKKVQLFLLPFAGGNASSFQKLVDELDSSIETIPIEYCGRGSRLSEGYITKYEDFLDDVVSEIKEKRNLNLPYALLGYSMGVAFCYEIASNKLLDRDPMHLFYGARECIEAQIQSEMTEDDFAEYALNLGGFPESVKNTKFVKLFMHPLKEDYLVAKQFEFKKGIVPNCDVTVFYSENDTPYETLKGWDNLNDGKTFYYSFGCNHFFINDYYKDIAGIINQTLW